MPGSEFEMSRQGDVSTDEPAPNWQADLMGCYDIMQWQVAEEGADGATLPAEDGGTEALMRYYND